MPAEYPFKLFVTEQRKSNTVNNLLNLSRACVARGAVRRQRELDRKGRLNKKGNRLIES